MRIKLPGIIIAASLLFSGCSSGVSTFGQNLFGQTLEAYYSTTTNVVCFTTSSENQDNVYCLPADKVITAHLKKDAWTAL